MKQIAALVFFAVFGLSVQLAATSADLKVSGNKIVTVSGSCPIFFKGVNIPSMEWLNAPDGPSGSPNGVLTSTQTMVANWGANIVRVPLNQDRWLGTACGVTAATYQGYVDQIVNWCNSNNVYVLLDLHWSDTGVAGGGSVCTSGQHDMPDDNSSTFWTSVATRYANNPAVLFDLYNEPKGITSWTEWRNGGNAQTDGGYHSPGMQGLLATVRATGANNIVVAGGLDWAFNLTGVPANALTDTASGHGVVYATHIYPWKSSPCTRAGGCFDNAIPAAVHNTYAVMVTEFGQNNGADGVPNNSWTQSVMDWAKANSNGYIAWCLHTGASPCLITDWTYTPSSWFGVTVKADMLATSAGGCTGTSTFTATLTRTPTATPTATPSRTRTASPTATGTRSVTASSTPSSSPSASATGTPSASRTATGTRTPANSPTFTPTATGSSTPTGTPSSTPSVTASASPSATATVTRSRTPTSSPSATPTSSGTASPTATPMGTFTTTVTSSATPSQTGTATKTATPAGTFTFTATSSVTSTQTGTATQTATPAGTFTFTVTFSVTSTQTGTATMTATPAGTFTCTATSSVTPTQTGTATRTATPAGTFTYTATSSATSTQTGTATQTATPAGTFTFTATSSATPSQTGTATQTETPLGSSTFTLTLTSTPTPTPIGTPLATSTPTSGPAAASGDLEIRQLVGVPDPNCKVVQLELTGPADEIELLLYTKAENRVMRWTLANAPAGWVQVPLGGGWSDGLASGAYYLTAQARQAGRHSLRKVAKLYLAH